MIIGGTVCARCEDDTIPQSELRILPDGRITCFSCFLKDYSEYPVRKLSKKDMQAEARIVTPFQAFMVETYFLSLAHD